MNLSIIIPIYNASAAVKECINSALLQLNSGGEIICIDDGSTDGSIEIVKDIARKDSRIKLRTQQNQGAGAARNAGIKAAKGEYIAFLDADDYYPSDNTLARLYAAAKTNNALICGGSFCEVNENKAVTIFSGARAGNTFTDEGWINFSDYQFDYGYYRFIYRRDFLLQNDLFFPNYRRYQDPPFMLHAFSAAGKFYAIPDITYCYRVNNRPLNWTVDKVYDLLCGIEDNLKFSQANNFIKAYALNYHRLCHDFKDVIVDTALNFDVDGVILHKLFAVRQCVDKEILAESKMFTSAEINAITPLSELTSKLSARSAQLYGEGWFINKKFFRIYTWPVRAIGKILKRRTTK